MKKKLVILGHRGFIGEYLFREFSKNSNFETTGFSSQEINLLDKEQVEHLSAQWNEQTTLVFCSAIGRATQDDEESFLKNILMFQHVAMALKKNPLHHCFFLSSIDVYGKPSSFPLDEETPPAPDSLYGWAKYTGEFLLKRALNEQKTILTILRLSGVYGPSEKSLSPLNVWIRTAIKEGRITLFGDGSERRDYVWVEDIYPVLCRMIDKKIEGVFNIATGQSYSLLEIIDQFKKIVSNSIEVVYQERKRPWLDYQFNKNALEKAIGPFPWTPLSQGLKSLYASYQHH